MFRTTVCERQDWPGANCRARCSGGLEANQCAGRVPREYGKMANHIFRCDRTGLNVQIRLREAVPTDPVDSYEAVTCPACTGVHFLNKATGRMLADKESKKQDVARP
jgi:hypothetical protein